MISKVVMISKARINKAKIINNRKMEISLAGKARKTG
jgi:hypothetical protein